MSSLIGLLTIEILQMQRHISAFNYLEAEKSLIGNQEGCNCPLACKEVDFKPMFFRSFDSNMWKFEVSYKSPQNITITEEQLYTSKNLFADVGAILGLLSGVSVVSIVEIVVFIGLSFAVIRK